MISEALHFVDMDGVIARTSLGLQRHLGLPEIPPTDYNWCEGIVDWSNLDVGFWAGLPVYTETLKVIQELGNVTILTHCFGTAAIVGKRMWLDEHWPGVEMINLKDKYLLAGTNRWLWDDYPLQIKQWQEAGGRGQLVRRSWNESI